MTAPAWPVSGREQPRWHGDPVTHDVRFCGDWEDGGVGLIATCEPCGWHIRVEGGHTAADLTRLERQHAGTEDP